MKQGDKIHFKDDLGNKYEGTIKEIYEKKLPDGTIRRHYYIEESNQVFLTDSNIIGNENNNEIKKNEAEGITKDYWNWHRQDLLKDLYIKHAEKGSNYREFIEDAMSILK